LNLWEYILNVVDELKPSEKQAGFEVIVAIIKNIIFDPIFLLTKTKEKKVFKIGKNITKEEVIQKYMNLLLDTQTIILNLFKQNHKNITADMFSFSASILG
jgi:hypothetical protein